jgi:hypothetical protein
MQFALFFEIIFLFSQQTLVHIIHIRTFANAEFKGLKPLVKQGLSNKGFHPLAHKSSLLRKSYHN